MTPELRTYFAPKRGLTETVVHRLVNSLDGRRNIDQEAATGVVCGILSMRGTPEFTVNRANLTKEECKAFDAVVDMHFGELLQRQSGRNIYAVRESFKQRTEVYDTLERNIPFKVTGEGVSYQNSSAITAPQLVKMINHHRAVTVEMTDVAKAFHKIIMDERLPIRFSSLGDVIEPCEMACDVAESYRDNLEFYLRKSGYMAVFVNNNRDHNRFFFSVADVAVSKFHFYLTNIMKPWFQSVGQPQIMFPFTTTAFDGGVMNWCGEAYEQELHALAGH